MKKTIIPPEYVGFYYLRSIDLMPERLGDVPPGRLSLEQCRHFRRKGWLFATREDAMRQRHVMRVAQITESLRVKGEKGFNLEFNLTTP